MGIRTPDLLIANETLYQLSYTPGPARHRIPVRGPIVADTGGSARGIVMAVFHLEAGIPQPWLGLPARRTMTAGWKPEPRWRLNLIPAGP